MTTISASRVSLSVKPAPRRAKAWWLLGFGLLAAAVVLLPWPFGPAPTTRHFTINSSQFQYEPGTLRVNRGDTVVFTLTASDVVHGLYLACSFLPLPSWPVFLAPRPGPGTSASSISGSCGGRC